jgi:hypothetical protein
MNEVQKKLESLLTKGWSQKVTAKLPCFEKDEWLTKILSGLLTDNLTNNLPRIIQILDEVIMENYGQISPLMLSPFYKDTISNTKFHTFHLLVEHLKQIYEIEPLIITDGLVEQAKPDHKDYDQREKPSPYSYKEESYAQMLYNITSTDVLGEYAKKEILTKRLNVLRDHFSEMKAKQFNIQGLVENGYISLVRDLVNNNREDNEKLKANLEELSTVMENLEKKGFDIYKDSNIQSIRNYSQQNKLHSMKILTEYLNVNAMIKTFGLLLKVTE